MPFELIAVPAGTAVGESVTEVEPTVVLPVTQPTEASTAEKNTHVPAPSINVTLERIELSDSETVFYFSMGMENKDPSLVSVMPLNAYVVDSLGQKIHLFGDLKMLSLIMLYCM